MIWSMVNRSQGTRRHLRREQFNKIVTLKRNTFCHNNITLYLRPQQAPMRRRKSRRMLEAAKQTTIRDPKMAFSPIVFKHP